MAYKPHAKQAVAHKAFLLDGYKRGVLLMGRQSGKTYFSVNHAWLSAVIKQGRYFVVFKTYKQAHEVVWRQYVPLIPQELIYKKNEQDLLIELNYIQGSVTLPGIGTIEVQHDENLPRSTIQLLGSDQADSHRGFKGNGIVFDEYADQDPNNWDAVYKHFFTTTESEPGEPINSGWAIFMGTPRGYNHFYDLIEDAKSHGKDWWENKKKIDGIAPKDHPWFYQEATWRDSPYVKKHMIEAERAEAERKGVLSTFMQEVELEFRAVQGAVYPAFDRKIHLIKPADIPEDLTIYAGIDFGYHTTAMVFVGIDKHQNWYIFDEVYGREEQLIDLLPRIHNVMGNKRLVLMIADSENRDAIEMMAKKGFPVAPVVKHTKGKGSINDGIDIIRPMLQPKIQLVGPPKPTLFISTVCRNFIKEFEAYKYPEDNPNRNPSDVPEKLNDHGPDALRYVALHLKFGIKHDDKVPKPEMLKNTNEYGLL